MTTTGSITIPTSGTTNINAVVVRTGVDSITNNGSISATRGLGAGGPYSWGIQLANNSTNPLSLGAAADLLVVSGDLNLDLGNASLLTVTDLAGSPNPFVTDTTRFALINYLGN